MIAVLPPALKFLARNQNRLKKAKRNRLKVAALQVLAKAKRRNLKVVALQVLAKARRRRNLNLLRKVRRVHSKAIHQLALKI